MQRDNKKEIENLRAFKEKDKFHDEFSNDLRLTPMSEENQSKLIKLINQLIDKLIITLENKNATQQEIKSVFVTELLNFNRLDYDTEEGEFIGDLFAEIENILNIDFEKEFSVWFYQKELQKITN